MTVSNIQWTESYRPETLDDVVGHDRAVQMFRRHLSEEKRGALPHVIMAGPPGVGKTAVAEGYANELYGDYVAENLSEFNASDDRGIDVVRDNIKSWCRKAPAGGHQFKIVFLDEADQLTKDAQSALRRMMEQFADTTRFVMTCNYVNRIIDPLQSRCAELYFDRLDDEHVRSAVERVIDGESIDADDMAVQKVVSASRGQVRDALLTLQLSVDEGALTEETVDLYTGVVSDEKVMSILETALEGDLDTATTRLDVELLKEGANPQHLVDAIFRVLKRLPIEGDHRAKCLECLAETEERVQKGMNPHLQFHNLLGHVYLSQGLSPLAQQDGGDE